MEIETQITGIKLNRADVFSRFTSVTQEVFNPDDNSQDRGSRRGSNASQKSLHQTIREKEIDDAAAKKIDEVIAQKTQITSHLESQVNAIKRNAEIQKDRVAIEFSEDNLLYSGGGRQSQDREQFPEVIHIDNDLNAGHHSSLVNEDQGAFPPVSSALNNQPLPPFLVLPQALR